MSFNIDKCKYMLIGYKKTSNLKHQVPTMIAANLERKDLIETYQEKDLGIYITKEQTYKRNNKRYYNQ